MEEVKNNIFSKVYISSDKPITCKKDDMLNVSPFANMLTRHIKKILKNPNSHVFALTGAWGCGKSSVVNLIKENFRDQDLNKDITYHVLEFNPWLHTNIDDLLDSYFELLIAKIESLRTTRFSHFKKELSSKNYLHKQLFFFLIISFLVLIIYFLKINPVFIFPFVIIAISIFFLYKVSEDFQFGDLSRALCSYTRKIKDFEINVGGLIRFKPPDSFSGNSLEYKKIQLEKEFTNFFHNKQRLLVIMDDLDRLHQKQLYIVFQLIKTISDFSGVYYILAYDEQILKTLLTNELGNSYLEKIIQSQFDMPAIKKESLSAFLNELIFNKYRDEINEPCYEFSDLDIQNQILPFISTLRSVKRLSYVVNAKWICYEKKLNFLDFVTMEAIKLTEPAIFNEFLKNIEFVKEPIHSGGWDVIKSLNKPASESILIAKALKALFPKLPDNLLDLKQRITHPFYWAIYIHVKPDFDRLLNLNDVWVFSKFLPDSYEGFLDELSNKKLIYGSFESRSLFLDYFGQLCVSLVKEKHQKLNLLKILIPCLDSFIINMAFEKEQQFSRVVGSVFTLFERFINNEVTSNGDNWQLQNINDICSILCERSCHTTLFYSFLLLRPDLYLSSSANNKIYEALGQLTSFFEEMEDELLVFNPNEYDEQSRIYLSSSLSPFLFERMTSGFNIPTNTSEAFSFSKQKRHEFIEKIPEYKLLMLLKHLARRTVQMYPDNFEQDNFYLFYTIGVYKRKRTIEDLIASNNFTEDEQDEGLVQVLTEFVMHSAK